MAVSSSVQVHGDDAPISTTHEDLDLRKKEKREKRKKDKESPMDGEKKDGKRKKRANDSEETPAQPDEKNSSPDEEALAKREKKERKKARKEAEAATALELEPNSELGSKPRKSEKRKSADTESTTNQDALEPTSESISKPRKSKKRKSVDTEGESTAPSELKTKSKKRKPSNEYPDPIDDATLSDQSKKALGYVFSQTTDPAWKFNKARQNWIIRNLWTSESIPEKYIPSVAEYLSKVQGRVRETLIESCNKVLTPSAPEDTESTVLPSLDLPMSDPAEKERRARSIVDALNSSPST